MSEEKFARLIELRKQQGDKQGLLKAMQGLKAFRASQETPTLGELEERALLESGGQLQTTETPDRTIGEQVKGAGETARALTLGGVAGLAGGALGSIEGVGREILSGEFGTGLAEETAQRRAEQFTKPFSPKTEAGQEMLGSVGEALEPLQSLPPFVPGGAQASILAKPALSQAGTLSKVVSRLPSSAKARSIELDAPDVNQAAKSSGNSVIESAKVLDDVSPEDMPRISQAVENVNVENLSRTKPIKAAQKQGFDATVLRSIETASPETKAVYRDMLKTFKQRRANAESRATTRTTDSVGKNVFKRYKALSDLKKVKGRAVDRAAQAMSKQDFNLESSTDGFFRDINDLGVRITRNNEGKFKADYSNVDATQIGATKSAIDGVLDRINSISGRKNTALDAHKMKKLARSPVEFGELPSADAKLASGFESALKRYAKNINDDLRKMSPDYAKANDDFKSVIEPLSDMDRVFKTIVKSSSGEALESGVGTKAARTIMSNNTGRAAMLQVLKETDEALAKNGVKFKDNVIKQAVFADELERVFGSEATTSLGGAVQRADEQLILTAVGRGDLIGAAASGLSKITSSRVSQKKAIEALERVLTEQAQPQ